MKHFDPKQLSEHIENSETKPFLLDVREPWEFDICHIENSVSLPMALIPERLNELDNQQELVVICHHGIRSRQVAMYLEGNGFSNVINLTGGVAAWAQEIDKNMSQY